MKAANNRIIVPQQDYVRTLLLASAYDPIICGHFGVEKTLERISRHWWWRGLSRDVIEYVRTCAVCQQMKYEPQRVRGLLQPILALYPWHTVTIDFVGKLSRGVALGIHIAWYL